MRVRAILIPVVLIVLASCGNKEEPTPPDATVADATQQQADSKKLTPDLGGLADLAQKLPCESEWRDAVHPQSKASTGAVTTTTVSAGVFQTVVDATAGGMSAAQSNPFVYVSLADGKRVDVDDYTAKKTSTAWDLAFRRATLLVNGGDSGPGQGALAILTGKTFEGVTTAPAAAAFLPDDFLDDKCQVKRNPTNDLWGAFGGGDGMWYTMDTSTMKLTPKDQIYVVRLAKGGNVKLRIDSYYDAKGTSANYTFTWSTL